MSIQRIVAPLPEQDWFIQRMQALGYKANPLGVCYGISHMGMQAILADDLDSFDLRLDAIYNIPLETFAEKIESIKTERKLNKKINPNWVPNDPLVEEIPAFCEGVELYQQPYLHPELFESPKPKPQDATRVTPLVQPQILKKLYGDKAIVKYGDEAIVKPPPLLGMYNYQELIAYFKGFSVAVKKMNKPLALILRNSNHVVTVGYNPISKQWTFINASHLPSQRTLEPEIIADLVASAFSNNGCVAFSNEIYVTKENAAILPSCIEAWKNQPEWKEMHTVSPEKAALYFDSNNSSWLYIAAKMGDLKKVKELLAAGADPEIECISSGATPLYIAAQNGHFDVVETLALFLKTKAEAKVAELKADATISNPEENVSSLYIPVAYGDVEKVKLLLNNHVDPNQACVNDGTTPLFLAASYLRAEIVKLLLDAGANPNLPRVSDGATPLFMAAGEGHLEIINLLLDAGADPNQACTDNGATPLDIAAAEGHIETVRALLKAGAKLEPSHDGTTALYRAAKKGNLSLVGLLLANGADVNSVFTSDPDSLAIIMGHTEIADLLRYKKELSLSNDDVYRHAAFQTCLDCLQIKTEEEAKAQLTNFKTLDAFAQNLIKITEPYHISTVFHTHSKIEEDAIQQINTAVDRAYHAFASGNETNIIIKELEGATQRINDALKVDPKKKTNTFFNSSILTKEIEDALKPTQDTPVTTQTSNKQVK